MNETLIRESRAMSGWAIVLGILMLFAGGAAIALPEIAAVAVSVALAWTLIAAGILHLIFSWYVRGHGGSPAWEVVLGLVYLIVGGFIANHPALALVTFILALSFYLIVAGVLEIMLAFHARPRRGWVWTSANGVLTLIIAVLIWQTWPGNAFWVVGTLAGISICLSGLARLLLALTLRHAA